MGIKKWVKRNSLWLPNNQKGFFAISVLFGGSGGVVASGPLISETFDNVTNFTNITNTLSASGGKGHGSAWAVTRARHNTDTGSTGHWTKADLTYLYNGDGARLYVRMASDGSNYYQVYFLGGAICVEDKIDQWQKTYNGTYSVASTYTVKISVSSGTSPNLKVYVTDMNTPVIDQTDTNNYGGSGQYIGVGIDRDNDSQDETVDNFTGDVL